MTKLQLPWWEFVVRAAAVYAALLVMVRTSGKRTIGQFTPFNLLVVMLLSESVSNSLVGHDESLVGGLIAAGTLIGLDVMLAAITARSPRADAIIEGQPVLIGRDGVLFDAVLRRERVAVSDVERALRAAQCELQDMAMAVLEADGEISILQRR